MSGRTRRKSPDLSGAMVGFSEKNEQFLKFLTTNSDDAFTRPWHRLEPGMRKNRLRLFVNDEADRFQFTEEDKVNMFQVLMKALERKQLNSKSVVNYDTEQQKILEIKGLVFHKQADGKLQFQFAERKVGTQRRKTTSSQPQSQEPPKQTLLVQEQE